MNSLFLLMAALIAFIFGYRFYSKLLASAIFKPSPDYSITAGNATGREPGTALNPYLLLGQHFGLVATAATLSGAALAVYWGWIPAFLWVVVGSTLAAGIYSIGSLWLCRRHPDESLIGIVRHYFSGGFVDAVLVLVLIVLTLLSALLLTITAGLFVDYPSAVLPVVAFLLISIFLSVFLRHRPAKMIAPATTIALLVLLLLLWPLGKIVIGFSGAINLDFAGKPLLTLNAPLAWIIFLSIFLYFAQRRPLEPSLGSRAWLSATLFVVMLLILFIGVLIDHPQILAPGFNAAAKDVRALPWLLVTITGGAIAGIYMLVANHYTAPRLASESDARVVGYGVVVLEGLTAVSAIIICTAGFASLAEWKAFYASWSGGLNPSYILQLYINGFNYFASFVGLSPGFSTNFAAMTLIALCGSTMEVIIGILHSVSIDASNRIGLPIKTSDRSRLVTILVIVMIIAATTVASDAPAVVMLYGMANQLLAAMGLLLLVLALENRNLPGQLPLGLALLLIPSVLWVIGLQLDMWWSQGYTWLILPGLGLFIIGGWILVRTGQILWKPDRFRGKT
ncbi:MAG: carbon starvation CstA family protein [Acidiferrobacterales bacterium]